MYRHIFSYRLRTILRDRELVFWTLAFPVLLASLFRIVFANIGQGGSLLPIPVAIVQDQNYLADQAFGSVVDELSRGDSALLLPSLVDAAAAEALLRSGQVSGVIKVDAGRHLSVASSGLRQSILRSFLDQYERSQAIVGDLLAERPAALPELVAHFRQSASYTSAVRLSSREPNELLILYFALLAMACFYGSYFGLTEVGDIQANLTKRAARINLSPLPKLRSFLASAAAAWLIHFGGQLVLLAFLRWVLAVDFGSQWPLLLLATLVGSMLSLGIGALVGVAVKGSENLVNGLVTAFNMVGAMLAGLMFPGMKFLVARHLPALRWLNPVGLLADSYYALYYFDDYRRFGLNLLILCAYTIGCLVAVYLLLRRRRYASI